MLQEIGGLESGGDPCRDVKNSIEHYASAVQPCNIKTSLQDF